MARTRLNGDQLGETGSGWTNYTSSSTIVGFTGTYTEKGVWYKRIGKTVIVYYNIAAASNGTTVSFTLPFAARAVPSGGSTVNGFAPEMVTGLTVNNSSLDTTPARVYVDPASDPSTVLVYRSMGAGAWTNSGNRAIRGIYIYEAA